jgi:hypothetical protein
MWLNTPESTIQSGESVPGEVDKTDAAMVLLAKVEQPTLEVACRIISPVLPEATLVSVLRFVSEVITPATFPLLCMSDFLFNCGQLCFVCPISLQ